MDITHCLQQPGLKNKSGVVCSGGLRRYVKDMGKLAITFNCHGIFMEVHDDPDKALCDGPTQFHLSMVEDLLRYFYNFLFKNNTDNNIKYIYEMSSKTIFFSDFYKICNLDKNINIFNNNSISIDGHYIIKFLKDNNITINIKYINFLITFYSLRSRLKRSRLK